MPVQTLGLDGQDHALFKNDIAALTQYRFLLVKPYSHAVSDQRSCVFDPFLLKLSLDEFVYFTGRNTGSASIDGPAMNLERQFVATHLLCAWSPKNGQPRLMSRTPSKVGYIIIAHEIAASEHDLALPAIHHAVLT